MRYKEENQMLITFVIHRNICIVHNIKEPQLWLLCLHRVFLIQIKLSKARFLVFQTWDLIFNHFPIFWRGRVLPASGKQPQWQMWWPSCEVRSKMHLHHIVNIITCCFSVRLFPLSKFYKWWTRCGVSRMKFAILLANTIDSLFLDQI